MGVFDAIKRAVGLGKQEKPVSWPASVPEPEPEPIQVAELTPAELVAIYWPPGWRAPAAHADVAAGHQ